MIITNPQSLGNFTTFVRHGRQSAPEPGKPVKLGMGPAKEAWQTFFVPPLSSILTDGLGNFRAVPLHRAMSVFNLLPNATSAAAGKDDLYVSLGTGTEVIARATKGGINVKTKVSSPANADDAIITGLANNGTSVPLTAVSQPRMFCRVNLSQITLQLFSATLDETFTSADPSASAGDGAGFVFDPTGAISGLTSASYPNWLAYQKIAGVDVYVDSGIAVAAGVEYDLDVSYDAYRIPTCMINGEVVDTTADFDAGTNAAVLTPLVGVKIIDGGSPTQHDFDLRVLSVERLIG